MVNNTMRKFLSSIAFISKALLLIAVLIFGWMYINVTNLVKGKKAHDNNSTSNNSLWGADSANADAPGGKGNPSTPFLAYFNGKEYKLENDILFGRPTSFNAKHETARQKYEAGLISPDLYKIAAKVAPVNGKLLFQIQEREIEESFFKWLKLRRVTHPKNTEIIVDSDYTKFYVLKRRELEDSLVLPAAITTTNGINLAARIADKRLVWRQEVSDNDKDTSIRFQKNDSVKVIFRNLKKDAAPFLVTKSWFRDWIPGYSDDWAAPNTFAALFQHSPLGNIKTAALLPIILGVWLLHKIGLGEGAFAVAPFIFGYQSCSLVYEYKDAEGNYQQVAVSEPRAWHYNNEIIELPRESVSTNGDLRLRVTSTKRHTLGFVGITQQMGDVEEKQFMQEEVRLSRAYHHRLGQNITAELNNRGNEYIHMVTGDVVDLEFDAPDTPVGENQKATYVIQSSGFYTALRPEYKKFADDWETRRAAEDKKRRGQLVSVSSYK